MLQSQVQTSENDMESHSKQEDNQIEKINLLIRQSTERYQFYDVMILIIKQLSLQNKNETHLKLLHRGIHIYR